MDSNDEPREEVKSKSWTEIIADQFSAVAWIKGLKIYLALFGIFSLLVYWSQPNPVCGVIGVILLIISYSLRVQESKVSSASEEQSDSASAPSSSKIGDSLRSATPLFSYKVWPLQLRNQCLHLPSHESLCFPFICSAHIHLFDPPINGPSILEASFLFP